MIDDKQNIISILEQITFLLELKGENVFKVNAFRKASGIISNIEGDIADRYEEGTLATVPGIGKGILSVIEDYFSLGYSQTYKDLLMEVPEGLIELNKIRGLGPKKALTLYNDFNILNPKMLEDACRSKEIAKIKGFTDKSAEKLLEELEFYKNSLGKIRVNIATELNSEIAEALSQIDVIEIFSVSGDFRRSMEIIEILEFVVFTNSPEIALKEIRDKLEIETLTYSEANTYKSKAKILIHLSTSLEEYNKILFSTTGSTEFIEKLKSIYPISYSTCSTEFEIFRDAGIKYIAPEMREVQIVERLNDDKFSDSDLELSAFKGCFHFHTNYSDGKNKLEEMITEAQKIGYQYFAVCDHSKASFQANGMSEERVFLQKEEIAKASDELGVTIFHGIEVDILKDGSLDFGNNFLENFDFVVASVHQRFSLNKDDMTSRMIKAVENRHTDVLGHPSGRLILERSEFEADFDKIIDACKANSVAIEINASAHRLDLDWRRIFAARDKGCIFSINPDAHRTTQLVNVNYGIKIARKAALKQSEVINCYNEDEFVKFIGRK
jgi:DNA polymerase (family 10)